MKNQGPKLRFQYECLFSFFRFPPPPVHSVSSVMHVHNANNAHTRTCSHAHPKRDPVISFSATFVKCACFQALLGCKSSDWALMAARAFVRILPVTACPARTSVTKDYPATY